ERHGPPGAVAPVRGGGQDAAGLPQAQGLDVGLLADGGVDERGYGAADFPALPGNLQRASEDAVDLKNGVRFESLGGQPGVEGVQVLGLEAVQAVLAQLRNDPPPDL